MLTCVKPSKECRPRRSEQGLRFEESKAAHLALGNIDPIDSPKGPDTVLLRKQDLPTMSVMVFWDLVT